MNNHNTISSEQLLERLNGRYATKQFDPNCKISAQNWATLEDALAHPLQWRVAKGEFSKLNGLSS